MLHSSAATITGSNGSSEMKNKTEKKHSERTNNLSLTNTIIWNNSWRILAAKGLSGLHVQYPAIDIHIALLPFVENPIQFRICNPQIATHSATVSCVVCFATILHIPNSFNIDIY